MDKKHFEIIDGVIDGDVIYIKNEIVLANARGGVKFDFERVVEELNSLENERKRKNKEIVELKWKNENLCDVIYGVIAYIKLKSKEWL